MSTAKGASGGTTRDELLDAVIDLPEPLVAEALAFVLFLKDGRAEERILRGRPAGDVSSARWWEVCRILCGVADPAIRDGFLRWAQERTRSGGSRMLAFACRCAAESHRPPEALVSALAADVVGQLRSGAVTAEARDELVDAFHALAASDERNLLQPLLARMLRGGDVESDLAAGAILGAMDPGHEGRRAPLDGLAGTNLDTMARALRELAYPRAARLVRRAHDKPRPSGIPLMAAALEGGAAGAAVAVMASLSRRFAVDVTDFWAELLSADGAVVAEEESGGYYLRLCAETPIGALPEIEEHFDYFIMNARAWVTGEKLYYDPATGAGVGPDTPFLWSVAAYAGGAAAQQALCRDVMSAIGNALLEERPFVIASSVLAPCLEGALRDRKLAPLDSSRKVFDVRRWRPTEQRRAVRREGLVCCGRRYFPGIETESARTHVLETIEEHLWPPLLALSSRTYPGDVGARLHVALRGGLVSLMRVALRAMISDESYLGRYLAEATGEVSPRVSALVRDPSVREAVKAGALRVEDEQDMDAWMAAARRGGDRDVQGALPGRAPTASIASQRDPSLRRFDRRRRAARRSGLPGAAVRGTTDPPGQRGSSLEHDHAFRRSGS